MSHFVVNISSDESDEEAGGNNFSEVIDDHVSVISSASSRTSDCNRIWNNVDCDVPAEASVPDEPEVDNNCEDNLDAGLAPSNSKTGKGKGLKRKSGGNSPDKGKGKASAVADNNAKKQKMLEEKAAKKAADELKKIYKPGECMKYMLVEGHPSLWTRFYMSEASRELAASGARARMAPGLWDPMLLVVSRALPRTLEPSQGQVRLSPMAERCNHALYVASAEEVSELVSRHELTPQLVQAQQLADCRLTLLLYKPKDFFNSNRRKTCNSNRMRITEIDLELALTDLLVSTNCDTVVASTPNELALVIVQYTKAIAEAPFKKAKHESDEQAQFYMRGDNKKCVALDKDGVTGMSRLWQQMIAVLPQSSLETSRALCAKYPTPVALYTALQTSQPTISEIAEVGVARAAAPGARARRLGPEFARKLHTLFTEQNGDTVIE